MRTIPVTIKRHVLPSEEGEGTAWFYRQNAFEQQETFRQVAFKYRRWPELGDGSPSKQAAAATFRAIQDVGRWWPQVGIAEALSPNQLPKHPTA